MAAITVNSRRESVIGDLRQAIINVTGVSTNTFTPGWDVIYAVDGVSLPTVLTAITIGAASITTPPAVTFTSSGAITAETIILWGR